MHRLRDEGLPEQVGIEQADGAALMLEQRRV